MKKLGFFIISIFFVLSFVLVNSFGLQIDGSNFKVYVESIEFVFKNPEEANEGIVYLEWDEVNDMASTMLTFKVAPQNATEIADVNPKIIETKYKGGITVDDDTQTRINPSTNELVFYHEGSCTVEIAAHDRIGAPKVTCKFFALKDI